MPQQKDLKRIVRSRMQKTGESYTAARVHILNKKKSAVSVPKLPSNYETLAGMSDAAVEKATGRKWPQWVETLDRWGAAQKPHRDIAGHVSSLGVPGWWSQTIAVGYERLRGLRAIGQRRNGTWEASKSRTFKAPLADLYDACSNSKTRQRWLSAVKVTVRTATAEKSMRLAFEDGTIVQFYFVRKGDGKSQLTVQHIKLPSKEESDRLKSFWSERLDALDELLSRKKK